MSYEQFNIIWNYVWNVDCLSTVAVVVTLYFRDYQAMPELDRYDVEGIDDNAELSDLSMSERMAAEREMRKRDREEMAATGRMRPGLLYGQITYYIMW